MHWQPVNEEKERKKENPSHTLLHSHTARALCPDSEIMREKRESEKEKGTGRDEGKSRVTMREKENTGNCPFENIGFYLVIKVSSKTLDFTGFPRSCFR